MTAGAISPAMRLFTSAIEWFDRASWGIAPLARHNFFQFFSVQRNLYPLPAFHAGKVRKRTGRIGKIVTLPVSSSPEQRAKIK
jgi:hypothetical protein